MVEYSVPSAGPAAPQAEAIPLSVVYQDADFVVVDKPAGMVVHPAPGHRSGTLAHALLGLGGGHTRAPRRGWRAQALAMVTRPRTPSS